jgi:hypothetical protein
MPEFDAANTVGSVIGGINTRIDSPRTTHCPERQPKTVFYFDGSASDGAVHLIDLAL